MRQHPISPVTEPTQYRAIGVVRGQYIPADPEQLTRGLIRTADGTEIEAVVLGRLLTLMRRHLDLAEPHLWVVYPRTREQNHLHLQMVGVWEPSTLAQDDHLAADADLTVNAALVPEADQADEPDLAAGAGPSVEASSAAVSGDALPEGDDYFSVRGELIYTRPETGDLVIKVRQKPRADGSRPVPFKLQLRGEIPMQHLRHFVSLDLRRQGQQLNLESLEVLEPVAQRGNRGGKGRRGGPDKSGGGGGASGGGRPRPPEAGPSRPAAHGKAISRPGR